MRFHLIDKICEWKKWESAVALKNVTVGCPDFLNKDQTLMETLLLESIYQTAAWLIVLSSDKQYRPTIISTENYSISATAKVGDQLKIKVLFLDQVGMVYDNDFVRIKGEIYCDHVLIASIDNAILQLLKTSKLEDTKDTEIYLRYLTEKI